MKIANGFRALLGGLIGVLFSAFLFSAFASAADSQQQMKQQAGQQTGQQAGAPLFVTRATALDGQPITLAGYKGKPLVVNFWARWCAPCRKEIPELAALHGKYREKGLTVLGLAVEDSDYRDSISEFAVAYRINYPVALIGAGSGVELMRALGNDKAGLPFTLVLAPDGRVVSKKLGAMTGEEMEAAAAVLFEQGKQ